MLYSDIPRLDAPVIYTGAFPILTPWPGSECYRIKLSKESYLQSDWLNPIWIDLPLKININQSIDYRYIVSYSSHLMLCQVFLDVIRDLQVSTNMKTEIRNLYLNKKFYHSPKNYSSIKMSSLEGQFTQNQLRNGRYNDKKKKIKRDLLSDGKIYTLKLKKRWQLYFWNVTKV